MHTGLFNYEEAEASAGWIKELEGEHVPETETYGINSFVYRDERPFHPEIGCQVYNLLFENFNPITAQVMKKTIYDAINKFEPRVTVLDVKIREDVDKNDLSVDIIFRLNNSEKPITLTTSITRAR